MTFPELRDPLFTLGDIGWVFAVTFIVSCLAGIGLVSVNSGDAYEELPTWH